MELLKAFLRELLEERGRLRFVLLVLFWINIFFASKYSNWTEKLQLF